VQLLVLLLRRHVQLLVHLRIFIHSFILFNLIRSFIRPVGGGAQLFVLLLSRHVQLLVHLRIFIHSFVSLANWHSFFYFPLSQLAN
jgi:hypothetical protein